MKAAAAIADPVRREILVLLQGGSLTAGDVAARFTISRPAISRHLRVLRESGLVRDESVGRQRVYTLDPAPLTEVTDWIAQFDEPRRRAWEHRLDALETETYRTRRDRGAPETGRVARELTRHDEENIA
ncbi:MAG TPA: metalloregulator ArsR/SmtB family transcription factor [Jiangellaceae bacterium]